MNKGIVIFLFLAVTLYGSSFAMEPNSQQQIQQEYQQLIKELSQGTISQAIINAPWPALLNLCLAINSDNTIDQQAKSAFNTWLEHFDLQTKIDILKFALEQKSINQAIVFYCSAVHNILGADKILDSLQEPIQKVMQELSASDLGQLILLCNRESTLYQLMQVSIKEKLEQAQQYGTFNNLLEKSENFQMVAEQDQEVNTAIQNALHNQSIENLNQLQKVFRKYSNNPIQGPKLTQAIQEIAKKNSIIKKEKNENSEQKITFTLKNEETYEAQGKDVIEKLKQSVTIANILYDTEGEDLSKGIDLSTISKTLFETDILPLLQYLSENKEQEIHDHLKNLSLDRLIDLINACNFLDIPNLLKAAIHTCAQKLIEEIEKNPQAVEQLLQTIEDLPNDIQRLVSAQIQSYPTFVKNLLTIKPSEFNVVDHKFGIQSLEWSRDSKKLAIGSFKTVDIYDCTDLRNISLLKTLNDHRDSVHSVAWSPNGKTLATASDDKTICVYDCTDMDNITLLRRLNDHISEVREVKWSPNNKALATKAYDGLVHIYKCTEQFEISLIKTFQEKRTINPNLIWSSDGKLLATLLDIKKVGIYDCEVLQNLKLLKTLTQTDSIHSIAWAPHERILATSEDEKVCILDCADPLNITVTAIITIPHEAILSAEWSSDGKNLAIAIGLLSNKDIHIYDCTNLYNISLLTILKDININKRPNYGSCNYSPASARWSPDGNTLATATDQTLCLYTTKFDNLTLSQALVVFASMQGSATAQLDLTQGLVKNVFDRMPKNIQQFINDNIFPKTLTQQIQNQATLTKTAPKPNPTALTITPTSFWSWQRIAQFGTLSALGFIMWQWFKK